MWEGTAARQGLPPLGCAIHTDLLLCTALYMCRTPLQRLTIKLHISMYLFFQDICLILANVLSALFRKFRFYAFKADGYNINTTNSEFCPKCICELGVICVTPSISLYSIYRVAFINRTHRAFCEVRTEFLCVMYLNLLLQIVNHFPLYLMQLHLQNFYFPCVPTLNSS